MIISANNKPVRDLPFLDGIAPFADDFTPNITEQLVGYLGRGGRFNSFTYSRFDNQKISQDDVDLAIRLAAEQDLTPNQVVGYQQGENRCTVFFDGDESVLELTQAKDGRMICFKPGKNDTPESRQGDMFMIFTDDTIVKFNFLERTILANATYEQLCKTYPDLVAKIHCKPNEDGQIIIPPEDIDKIQAQINADRIFCNIAEGQIIGEDCLLKGPNVIPFKVEDGKAIIVPNEFWAGLWNTEVARVPIDQLIKIFDELSAYTFGGETTLDQIISMYLNNDITIYKDSPTRDSVFKALQALQESAVHISTTSTPVPSPTMTDTPKEITTEPNQFQLNTAPTFTPVVTQGVETQDSTNNNNTVTYSDDGKVLMYSIFTPIGLAIVGAILWNYFRNPANK